MTIPHIPGYIGDESVSTLANSWEQPEGSYPQELWPTAVLESITSTPTDWVTIVDDYFSQEAHGGRSSLLIEPSYVEAVLDWSSGWTGEQLGAFEPPASPSEYQIRHSGIIENRDDYSLEFFAQLRNQHGLRSQCAEVAHPFLWYWDAIQTSNGWDYLDEAGRSRELIRVSLTEEYSCISVRSLELRRYLADVGRVLLVQVDHVPKATCDEPVEMSSEYHTDWASFGWNTGMYSWRDEYNGFARLLGQYVIIGGGDGVSPWWTRSSGNADYPEFIYGIDPVSGDQLRYTCDYRTLGTYFDDRNMAPHYLTPVYFDPKVLERYVSEPERYEVTHSQLRCLDLWSVSISICHRLTRVV